VARPLHGGFVAGVVPDGLILPEGRGRQRIVRITREVIAHLAKRHPDQVVFCLTYMPEVLARPEYTGHRARADPRRVEFVRRVGPRRQLLLVAVKFLEDTRESWVSTAVRVSAHYLTRRLRAGTMREVSRGP
jgi:hypothetical protein